MNWSNNQMIDTGFVNRLSGIDLKNLDITTREKEVLSNLAMGQTNKEIAQKLMLSPSTVRNHISSIFTKLRISNRSQATLVAIYAGLLNPKADITEEVQVR